MPRRKARRFYRVGESLPAVLRRLGMEDALEVYRAVAEWPGVVGPGIAQHTSAVRVEEGTLIVVVDSPAWMTQLAFLKGQIIERLSAQIGAGRVKDIRFVLKREAPSS